VRSGAPTPEDDAKRFVVEPLDGPGAPTRHHLYDDCPTVGMAPLGAVTAEMRRTYGDLPDCRNCLRRSARQRRA
jgi:hypothetical protein